MYFEPFGPGVQSVFVNTSGRGGDAVRRLGGRPDRYRDREQEARKVHHDIEAGRYLILIYARKEQGAAVRNDARRHPEAELVAVDKHFINPFSAVAKDEPRSATRRTRQQCARDRSMALAIVLVLLVVGSVLSTT